MTADGGMLSRDPNLCASCSSLADGMAEGNDLESSNEVLHEVKEQPVGMLAVVEAESQKDPHKHKGS